ncbi:MAG TPA: AMP-binding protein [Acidimicrobiales bacterium]|nr:AMP-binding protein [Acidimicrobiales bacterium]
MDEVETIAQAVVNRADDDSLGLWAGPLRLTHAEVVGRAAARAGWLLEHRTRGPFHVAVLLDNVPEFVYWLEAAALVGAVVVGANPTHRGDELARDLAHTDCQLLVTESASVPVVDGLHLGDALGSVQRGNRRVLVLDSDDAAAELAPYEATAAHRVLDASVSPETLGYLLFTSGTSGAPKACLCTQGRLARIGSIVAQMFALTPADVCYLSMPLFHSNALMAGWGPALMAGSACALPSAGRFSASGFLPDVRASGATYFNYVGKPLAYVLATPERPDDADNPLVRAFGNEGSADDVARFAERFGVAVTDSYGSTEGGATVARTPDTPPGALGRAPEGTVVLNPETGDECPPAVFDAQGRLLNADEAIGELVSKPGGAGFEGYWHNDDAEKARLKNGWYWTGDLAYRDQAGFFYFAGRDHDWLRVDGENFAAAPVERILQRHPDVMLAAVYPVPDPVVGDQVMATVQLRAEADELDPAALADFLAAQGDLGTKWAPQFVRMTRALPITATNKVLKRALRAERWNTTETVLWKSAAAAPYTVLSKEDATRLDAAVAGRVL